MDMEEYTATEQRQPGGSTFVATALTPRAKAMVRNKWRGDADKLKPKRPKLATLMDGAAAKRSWKEPQSAAERARSARARQPTRRG